MLHYDFWQTNGGSENLQTSIQKIGDNPVLGKRDCGSSANL